MRVRIAEPPRGRLHVTNLHTCEVVVGGIAECLRQACAWLVAGAPVRLERGR